MIDKQDVIAIFQSMADGMYQRLKDDLLKIDEQYIEMNHPLVIEKIKEAASRAAARELKSNFLNSGPNGSESFQFYYERLNELEKKFYYLEKTIEMINLKTIRFETPK